MNISDELDINFLAYFFQNNFCWGRGAFFYTKLVVKVPEGYFEADDNEMTIRMYFGMSLKVHISSAIVRLVIIL